MNFANVKEWNIPEGKVLRVIDSQNVVLWEKQTVDYTEPFYIQNLRDFNINVSLSPGNNTPSLTIQSSTNKSTWTTEGTISSGSQLLTLQVPANGKLYLRCNADTWYGAKITSVQNHAVGGNILSLLYGSSFDGTQTSFKNNARYQFYQLFYGNLYLTSAYKLLLPVTTLSLGCYKEMFTTCTSLTTAPNLPATRVLSSCYAGMFYNCTSLTTAPELPATSLSTRCYRMMFKGSSVNYVKCLATSGISTDNTYEWLSETSSTGTFIKAASATWSSGVSGIHTGWTVVDAQ